MNTADYNLVAAAIKEELNVRRRASNNDAVTAALNGLAHRLSDRFKGKNPNFKGQMFIEACGFK